MLIVALAAAATLAATAARAAEPNWSYEADDDIVFQRLTPLGSLLVSTGSGLHALDPATGRVVWTNAGLKNLRECNYDELVNSPLALVEAGQGGGTRRRVMAIDLATGQPRWDSTGLPFMTSQGVLQAPQRGMLVVAGVDQHGGKSVICGVDAETGALVWQQEGLFTLPLQLEEVQGSGKIVKRFSIAGNQLPLFPTADTAILYLNAEGPVKIDLNTGHKLWRAPITAERAPALSDGFAQMGLGDGVVFVPFENSLQAVDLATGKPLWAEPPQFKSHVAQMALTPHGLVVRGAPRPKPGPHRKPDGKPFLDMLDPATGASMWTKPFRDLDAATTFDLQGDQLFICADGELFAMRLEDGSTRSIAKVKFEGNERPERLELIDDDYVLSASRNLMRIDPAGNVRFHEFYPSPGPSGWIKALGAAAARAGNAASSAGTAGRAPRSAGNDFPGTPAGDPELTRRFNASQIGSEFQSILTAAGEGGKPVLALVKLDKTTGKKVAEVVLGEQPPEYQIDSIDNLLFLKRSDRRIDCFAF